MAASSFSEDLVTEILKRLPVSSLIRFMSVQKSWYHLIQSPYFKALYSHHQNNTYILFHCRGNHCVSLRVNDKQCSPYASVPYPTMDGAMEIYGISNGLLCLCHSKIWYQLQQIYLWNPIIRKCKTLPDPPLLHDDLCLPFVESSAFGYLPEIDDYKVIKIKKYHGRGGEPPQSNFVYVYVYSLSTNSWKTVEKDNFAGFDWIEEGSVVLNGAAYWLGLNNWLTVIVCFDIEREIIREIMLPPQCSMCREDFQVTLVQKSSDLSLFCTDFSEGRLDIWILESEAEIKDIWTKKYTLDLTKITPTWKWWPEDFRNNDEIMLLKRGRRGCGYMSYDIEKDEPTVIIDELLNLCSDLDHVKPWGYMHATPFLENLVLLGED